VTPALPLTKVKRGDTSEKDVDPEDVLKRYVPALRRLAWSYTRDPGQREDLFQEIAVAVWKALPNYRGDSSERTYVYRVAHNTALRFVMSHRQLAAREQGPTGREIEPVSADNPERDAIRNQRRQRLWQSIANLPVVDRQIALLHLEGLSTAEVVDVTGLNEGMVAMRLSRLRRRLAEELNSAASPGKA
jgi:RNA polymerase sigma-70 factor (ECF subfamily)